MLYFIKHLLKNNFTYITILRLNCGYYATNDLYIAANLPDYDNQFPTGARAIVVECIFRMHTRKYHGYDPQPSTM